MKTKLFAAIAIMFGFVATAAADPWKDESGHGKWKHHKHEHKREWREGETPWYQRGKGYWDGHFKHGRGGPPRWSNRWDHFDDDYDRPRVRVRVYGYEYPRYRDYNREPHFHRYGGYEF